MDRPPDAPRPSSPPPGRPEAAPDLPEAADEQPLGGALPSDAEGPPTDGQATEAGAAHAPAAGAAAAPPALPGEGERPALLPPPELPARIQPRSPLVAFLLGWALPGLGQVYAGRALKGALMATAILALFYGGLVLTGFTAVDPYTYGLEFVAHAWIGGPTAVAYWLSRDVVLTQPLPHLEVGRLYVAVAGLLNIVAMCDAMGGVLEHNERAAERDEEREELLADHAAGVLAAIAARTPAGADEADDASAPSRGTSEPPAAPGAPA